MAVCFWLSILIVSSLAPFALQSELVSNQTSVVPQWIAPPQQLSHQTMSWLRAPKNAHFIGSPVSAPYSNYFATKTNNSYEVRKVTAPVGNFVDSSNGTGYRGANPPNGGQIYISGFKGGPNSGPNGGQNYPPGGYGSIPNSGYGGAPIPGYGGPPNAGYGGASGAGYGNGPDVGYGKPANYVAHGDYDDYGDSSFLIILATFKSDQCEGHKHSNYSVILLLNRYAFCKRRAVVSAGVLTITENPGKQCSVSKVQILISSVTQLPDLRVIQVVLHAYEGPLAGKFIMLRLFFRDNHIDRKCYEYFGNFNIIAENVQALFADNIDLGGCKAVYGTCHQKIKESATCSCNGKSSIL